MSIKIFHLIFFRRNNDLFISCLMQSTNEDCSNYALEVIIRKSNGDKILGKELITRNKIYCLENKSWQVGEN